MGKLLEVREFDAITCNADYENDEKYKYLDTAVFHDLIDFIREFSADEENADALDFMRITYKRNVGDVVTVKNYVGLIQMKNGYQVQILPKISFVYDGDSDNSDAKRVFLKMLRSMKDFPGKEFNDANLHIDRMNLYEIFINMYLQEVRKLVKHGIKSAYINLEDNLKFYKGKLLVSQQIRKNATHRESFYVSFDEFHPNRVENKIIKATLLKLRQISISAENSKEISQLLNSFEMVEASVNYTKDFSQVKIDRSTKEYEMLMKWSKVFLFNKSFTTFSGKNKSRALLFPMESVYESYVAKYIKKALNPYGWEVSSQDKGHYLFSKPRKQFALRPDLVCRKGNRTVIMDTKWKNLVNNDRINYGISQEDMYQMYAYSKKYETVEVWLLYPLNEDMRNHSEIIFESEDGTMVRLYFINVASIEASMSELRNKLEE